MVTVMRAAKGPRMVTEDSGREVWLCRMLLTCTPAVVGLMYSSAPICALVRPAASSRSTASSRAVSP